MSDDLIERAQQGDDAAFQQIVQAYTPLVRRVVRTFLADRAVAEDIIQDAWLDVWRGLPRFNLTRPFRPWVLTIVANRCRMVNRRRVLATTPLDATAHDIAWAGEDASEQMIRSETDAALTAALAALAPELRQLIELRYFAKLEIADIAAVSDVPAGTVKSRISRTLLALRTHLRELDSEVHEAANPKKRHE